MRVEGCRFPSGGFTRETVWHLAPRARRVGPGAGEREAMLNRARSRRNSSRMCCGIRPTARQARDYLNSRGITVKTARAFMMGFAPSRPASLAKALEKRGLSEAGIKEGWLGKTREAARLFRGRVMFRFATLRAE